MASIGYFKTFRFQRNRPTVRGREDLFPFGKTRESVEDAFRKACAHKYYLDKNYEGGSRIAKFGSPLQYGEWTHLPNVGRFEDDKPSKHEALS